MEKLHAFKPREIQLMLCGEQVPKWTYDELLLYTEPKYGYHKDSPGFLRLLKVLVAMNGDERKVRIYIKCRNYNPQMICYPLISNTHIFDGNLKLVKNFDLVTTCQGFILGTINFFIKDF